MSESLTFSLQALLARHEQYMADAELDRARMGAKIESLEADKKELEAENSRTIEENRNLLDQLEGLNETLAVSDTHVKSLEATLLSTNQELRRLEGLAARTYDLEAQLAVLEQQQAVLQRAVLDTEDDERTAIRRWKAAESELLNVQEQLEKIERETREERSRHDEVVGRMERQRLVEKELDGVAGRHKGTAGAGIVRGDKNGSSVVSHFVKDILQDNANLQLGIVELREMLMSSNDEVQTLREQLLLHQPVEDREHKDGPSSTATLEAELASKPTHVVSQELHIHHHYHTPVKAVETRRPKKKRNVITSASPTPAFSNARAQRGTLIRPTPPSIAAAILSQTSSTIPSPTSGHVGNRWSTQSVQSQSDFAPSSVPSSPQSNYRNSYLFDRAYNDPSMDSSRPTSPGSSVDPMSPMFLPHHRKRVSEQSTRSFTAPSPFSPHGNGVIEEEDDDIGDLPDLVVMSNDKENPVDDSECEPATQTMNNNYFHSTDDIYTPRSFRPALRRSASHESILSIAGIDIHTLKARPSQLTITDSGALLPPRGRREISSPTTSMFSTEAIISASMATARPTLTREGHDSSSYLRSSIGVHSVQGPSPSSSHSNSSSGLGRKVGGWVWGKWGVAPTAAAAPTVTPTPADFRAKAAVQRTVSTPVESLQAVMGRPPGVNQNGPIKGFRKPDPTPSSVQPVVVDQAALSEVLEELMK